MTDLTALKAANAKRWANAKVTRAFSPVARHLVDSSAKSLYRAIAAKTAFRKLLT
jgi:hypothetical protein